jgi:CheY-like chemotaxis protein
MPNRLKNIQVLLVEDEPDIAVLLIYILESSGAKVIAATTALEALQVLDTQHPHILVCNLRLPDLDGIELLQKIRLRHNATVRRMPAIAVTSYNRDFCAAAALRAGFDEFLSKPIEADALITSILQLVAQADKNSSDSRKQVSGCGNRPSRRAK